MASNPAWRRGLQSLRPVGRVAELGSLGHIIMDVSSSTASEAIWGGFLVFGVCSFFGLRLFLRGLRDDTLDASGHSIASRGWFIGGGILLQLPLVGFIAFAWRQGFFGS
jgi:hypothetical protein